MSSTFNLQSADGIIADKPGDGKLIVVGTGAPTNSQSGFATGCLYIRLDGGSSTSLYVNEGSNTSTTWAAK